MDNSRFERAGRMDCESISFASNNLEIDAGLNRGEVLSEPGMMELTVFTKTFGFAPQSWWRSGTFHPLKVWGGFSQENGILNEEARHFLVVSLSKIMRSIIHFLSEFSGSEFVNSLHPVIYR